MLRPGRAICYGAGVKPTSDPIEVPYSSLQSDTLNAVVEEFVTRPGTDYGERERSLDAKIDDVMRQLRRGEAKLVFDPETGTVNIVPADPRSGRSKPR